MLLDLEDAVAFRDESGLLYPFSLADVLTALTGFTLKLFYDW